MTSTHSPNLKLPLVQAAQSQKHITVNQALQALDVLSQMAAFSRNETTPPISPENGDRYLIPANASGDWADHEHYIAVWLYNSWLYFPPRDGWRLWIIDEERLLVFINGSWVALPLSVAQLDAPLHLFQTSISNLPDPSPAGRIIYVSDAIDGPNIVYSDNSSWRRISNNTIIN